MRNHLRQYLGEDLWQQLDIRYNTYQQIMASEAMSRLQASWVQGDFKPCVDICGIRDAATQSPRRSLQHLISLASDQMIQCDQQ
jgi:hypothetical protein